MNKKILFTIAPAVLLMSALTGCSKTVGGIVATCDKKSFKSGDVINKSEINVVATYSDNSTATIATSDWTCSEFTGDTYTFKDEDAPSKEFVIKYGECSSTVVVNVTVDVKELTIDKEELYFTVGDTIMQTLKASISPALATNKKIKWSAAPADVLAFTATVTQSGYTTEDGLKKTVTTSQSVTITAESDEDPSIKATCSVKVETVLDKFLRLYKPYNDSFQNGETKYYANQIKYSIDDGVPVAATSINYVDKEESTARSCTIDDSYLLAGKTYELETFKTELSSLVDEGNTLTCIEGTNTIGIQACDQTTMLLKKYVFNSSGYLLTLYDGTNRINFTYTGEPYNDDEESFYSVYKTASDNFQKSTDEYDKEDITIMQDGTKIDFDSVSYATAEGVRTFTIKIDDEVSYQSGGIYTYYDDTDKGIKSVIAQFESAFGDASYFSIESSGQSGFYFSGHIGMYFNSKGYLYKMINDGHVVDIIYND